MGDRLSEKVFIIGIDGMDPKFTRYMLRKGRMPNVKRLIEVGGMREDLILLGNHPTVTPPMWTTLSTGATPRVHGIHAFSRTDFKDGLEYSGYNLDSRYCKAEQLWDVTAIAGIKTLVFNWPGCSWPPTSNNPNLHVVDGQQPSNPGSGVATVDAEFMFVADIKTEDVLFRRKCASDSHIPCVINDLAPEPQTKTLQELTAAATKKSSQDSDGVSMPKFKSINLTENDGERGLSTSPFDVVLSPIKEAYGWANSPEGAKEFTMLFSGGLLRRVGLILKNELGIYDTVALYKSKKETEPIIVMGNDQKSIYDVFDQGMRGEQYFDVFRNMRIFELAEDGTHLKMWVSGGLDIHNDTAWSPRYLCESVYDMCGPVPQGSMAGCSDEVLIKNMRDCWSKVGSWFARAIKHLIATEGYEMIFSHYHNVDAQGHMLIKYLKGDQAGKEALSPEKVLELLEGVYDQTDEYIGQYLDMLEDGWTLLVLSDHGQLCGPYEPPMLGDSGGVDIGVMRELGFTEVIKDEKGKDTYEIDWSKTKAISKVANYIYLNLKGRTPYGIIEPEDQYEVEEEIITALYGYRYPQTGKRVVALALRNKDAAVLGMGGEGAGDIIYMLAEGYNYDHVDSLSTMEGIANTSVSPIFMAAGPGIKKGFTDRLIKECDVAPTIAVLLGVRMPAQCEGAPAYQIIDYEHVLN